MNKWVWGMGIALTASLFGCSAGPGAGSSEEAATGISLQLGAPGKSGAHYRLGPASFEIKPEYDYWSYSAPLTILVS